MMSSFISECTAQVLNDDSYIKVSLRMIGHRVLLSSGDSISRVLPIVKENDHYRIQFESEFGFIPEKLVSTVDEVVKKTKLANNYIIEVEKCETRELVYSFKMDVLDKLDIIPCKTRIQPKSCYSLLFMFAEKGTIQEIPLTDTPDSLKKPNTLTNKVYYSIIVIVLVLVAVVFFFVKKSGGKPDIDSNMISLGDYYFDKRNTALLIEHQRIELTNKEADLLLLLYNAVNITVEREVILNRVWGDEGDYVGRTLDVFISKLRKKLEFDAKVKIVNVRGVGYKLIMNV